MILCTQGMGEYELTPKDYCVSPKNINVDGGNVLQDTHVRLCVSDPVM
jgi:hypothetical protein